MGPDQKLALTRRAFATGMTGSLALLPGGRGAFAIAGADPSGGAALRDAALRGLARAGDLGDPVLAIRADGVLADLETSDPEGAALVRVYRRYDVESAPYRLGGRTAEQPKASYLDLLHGAVRDCRAVAFHYTDLEGEVTARTVLPLALVHPPQGIKLLAWCELRQDCRQFFVRAIAGLSPGQAMFAERRLALLRLLVDRAGSSA